MGDSDEDVGLEYSVKFDRIGVKRSCQSVELYYGSGNDNVVLQIFFQFF